MEDRRTLILNTIDDLVSDFLYYNRKEDEELPTDSIHDAIENGEISIDEIVRVFEFHLTKNIP